MKLNLKSFAAGVIVATIGVTTVFAAGGIKSAAYNTNKVTFDGVEIDLSNDPMISVVKEGEEYASNYMPVRALLEAMGYGVDWDSETRTVVISSAEEGSGEEEMPATASMPNPWETCTEAEAFEYLGAKFEIEPPEGYELSEVATLMEQYAEEAGKTARFAYTNDKDEMFRVHIYADAAEEVVNQGSPVKANDIDAYFNEDDDSVAYAEGDYMIIIDMLGKSKEEVLKAVGSVTLAE